MGITCDKRRYHSSSWNLEAIRRKVLAVNQQSRKHWVVRAALAIVILIAVAAVWNLYEVRTTVKWLVFSHRYKSAVLSESYTNGELRHIEWDGWGGTPVGDWTAYIVYDPTDSLSAMGKRNTPAKYRGIPCSVISVRRLEKDWYSVVLDMNEFWDKTHPTC